MKLFTRSKKEKGWLVIDESPEEVKFVHGRLEPGAKAAIDAWTSVDTHVGLERVAKEKHFERYRCATLLKPGEYQLLLVEARSNSFSFSR